MLQLFIFESILFFFRLFFPLLFLDLLLKLKLHLLALLVFFALNYIFFVAASKNTALLFEFNVQTTFNNATPSHNFREILFSLSWGVRLTRSKAVLLIGWFLKCWLLNRCLLVHVRLAHI